MKESLHSIVITIVGVLVVTIMICMITNKPTQQQTLIAAAYAVGAFIAVAVGTTVGVFIRMSAADALTIAARTGVRAAIVIIAAATAASVVQGTFTVGGITGVAAFIAVGHITTSKGGTDAKFRFLLSILSALISFYILYFLPLLI